MGWSGNPWALDRSAGGSSSGSGAAVAAGLSPFAVGTETDGSIVCPASVNGVVGLKPTVGAVPTDGIVPISASQDSPGPLGRSVADVALLFAVLSGQEPVAPGERSPRFVAATSWRTDHPPTDQSDRGLRRCPRAGRERRSSDRDVATPGPDVVNDEFVVLLSELVDDLGAYLAARPGGGVRSLADVVAHEQEHAGIELPWFGHELFLQALGDLRPVRRRPTPVPGARNLEWAVDHLPRDRHWTGPTCWSLAAYGPAWKSDLVVGGHAGAVSSWVTTPAAIAGWPIMSVPVGTGPRAARSAWP